MLWLDIASAHIATFGEKVIDSFYATDLVGFKITSPQKLAAVRRKLMSVLGGSTEDASKASPRKQSSSRSSVKGAV